MVQTDGVFTHLNLFGVFSWGHCNLKNLTRVLNVLNMKCFEHVIVCAGLHGVK